MKHDFKEQKLFSDMMHLIFNTMKNMLKKHAEYLKICVNTPSLIKCVFSCVIIINSN